MQSDYIKDPSCLHNFNDSVFYLVRNRECDQRLCGEQHPASDLHQQYGSHRTQHQGRPFYQVKLEKTCQFLNPFLNYFFKFSTPSDPMCNPSVFLPDSTWMHFQILNIHQLFHLYFSGLHLVSVLFFFHLWNSPSRKTQGLYKTDIITCTYKYITHSARVVQRSSLSFPCRHIFSLNNIPDRLMQNITDRLCNVAPAVHVSPCLETSDITTTYQL